MTKFLLSGALALGLMSGGAIAQTTTSQSTTTTVVTPIPPQPKTAIGNDVLAAPATGTLSTITTEKVTGSDGSQTNSISTTYNNPNGVAKDSVTTTTTYPPAATTTTNKTTTTTTTTTP